MTREEFIGKLRSIYVGEENAIDEIISEYNSMINLNKQLVEECRRLDDEETRLNNIIDELEKWCQSWKDNDKYCYLASSPIDKCRYDIWEEVLDKLKELKEDNNGK